ncbi:hypothetical protein [Lysobacter xanthus]
MRIVEFVGLVVAALVVMALLVGKPHVLPDPASRPAPPDGRPDGDTDD